MSTMRGAWAVHRSVSSQGARRYAGSLSSMTATSPGASTSTAPPSAKESQAARAEKLMRRFWKTVSVEEKPDGRHAVLLDKRTLKTPGGSQLLLDKSKLPVTLVIAHEWENQKSVLKPHALPMTSLAARAIDGLSDEETRKGVTAFLLRYLDTDAVCFHEESPPSLVQLQEDHWRPLIKWVEEKFDVKIVIYDGILGSKQPQETIDKLSAAVNSYDQYKLAAFERAVLASKSYLIGLGIVEGHLSVDDAAKAAHVEVQHQINRWGEVEDTHDVDYHDIRVRLGSAALLSADNSSWLR